MRATKDSWKQEPFTTGLAIPYSEQFTQSQYAMLQEGLIPEVMEDKWFIYFDEPFLFFHRSWTGKPVYRAKLRQNEKGAVVDGAECVSEVIKTTGASYQAQLLDFLISNLLLRKSKPFPLPPGVPDRVEGLLQHSVSGTFYPQTSPKRDD